MKKIKNETINLQKKGKLITLNVMTVMLGLLVVLFAILNVFSTLNSGNTVVGNPIMPENKLEISNGGLLDLQGGENNGSSNVFVDLKDGAAALKHVEEEFARQLASDGYRIGGFGTSVAKVSVAGVNVTVQQIEYENIVVDHNGNVSGEGGLVGYQNEGLAAAHAIKKYFNFCYDKENYYYRNLGENFDYTINEKNEVNFMGDFSKAEVRTAKTEEERKRKGYLESPDIFIINERTAKVIDFKVNEIKGYVSDYSLKISLNDEGLALFKYLIKDQSESTSFPNYNSFYLTIKINRNGTIQNMLREENYTIGMSIPGIGSLRPTVNGSKLYNIVYNKPGYVVEVK